MASPIVWYGSSDQEIPALWEVNVTTAKRDAEKKTIVTTTDKESPAIRYFGISMNKCRLKRIADLFENAQPIDGRSKVFEKMRANLQDTIHQDTNTCISLTCCLNHFEIVESYPKQFNKLRSLDLSVNMITKMEHVEQLKLLRELNLANNNIRTIQGLENLRLLRKLNLGMNKIRRLEGIDNLHKLTDFRIDHNRLVAITGCEGLYAIERFDASNNSLIDIAQLSALDTIKHLDLGNNSLDDLSETVKTIVSLPCLESLVLEGNRIESEPSYRLWILDNPTITAFDHMQVKPFLRARLELIKTKRDLEETLEQTSHEYAETIQAEYVRKEHLSTRLRNHQKHIDNAFNVYKLQMEKELDECSNYVQAVVNQPEKFASEFIASGKGIATWKRMVKAQATAREQSEEQLRRQDLEEASRSVAEESQELPLESKLAELSFKAPAIWYEMKQQELTQQVRELVEDPSSTSQPAAQVLESKARMVERSRLREQRGQLNDSTSVWDN